MFPSIDEITVAAEDIGSITLIMETRFQEWVEIWKKWVMPAKGFGDFIILKYSNSVYETMYISG